MITCRYEGNEGELFARLYPCFCRACMDEDFGKCEHAGLAGFEFKHYVMRKKGRRVPKGRVGGELQEGGNQREGMSKK